VGDFGRFRFVDEWRIGAPAEVVWPAVTDLETWSQWWPAVRRVVPLSPGTPGGGSRWEFRFRTRLPYDMGFVAEVVRDDVRHTGEARVAGRVVGAAAWRVAPVDGGAQVRFEWEVRPQPAWMRMVAPLARPMFSWNHRSLMAEGAFGLARHLDTGLLATPVGVLLPA
jgi:hypothetical protein